MSGVGTGAPNSASRGQEGVLEEVTAELGPEEDGDRSGGIGRSGHRPLGRSNVNHSYGAVSPLAPTTDPLSCHCWGRHLGPQAELALGDQRFVPTEEAKRPLWVTGRVPLGQWPFWSREPHFLQWLRVPQEDLSSLHACGANGHVVSLCLRDSRLFRGGAIKGAGGPSLIAFGGLNTAAPWRGQPGPLRAESLECSQGQTKLCIISTLMAGFFGWYDT